MASSSVTLSKSGRPVCEYTAAATTIAQHLTANSISRLYNPEKAAIIKTIYG